MVRASAVLTLVSIATLALPSSAAGQACDRACLRLALDTFLTALVAHDPSAAGLAPTFRYTENAIDVRPGAGLWQTATRLGPVQRRYLDPLSGQAAYFGLIEEGAESGIATLRLQVVAGGVTEGELVIGRRANGIFDAAGLAQNPPADGPLPAAKRTPRNEMVKAANSYFDGLETKKSDVVIAARGCPRIENGVMMTGMRGGRGAAPPVDRGDCANMSGMAQISAVVNRRFSVVDEEAGIVVGMAVFNRPPGARRGNGTLWPRNLLTEVFAIESGRITAIHAAMHYLEPDVPNAPGWVAPTAEP